MKNATKRAFAKKIVHNRTNIFSVSKIFWSAPLPRYHAICHPAIYFLYQSSHLDSGDNKCSLEFNATDKVKDKGPLRKAAITYMWHVDNVDHDSYVEDERHLAKRFRHFHKNLLTFQSAPGEIMNCPEQ